MDFPPGDSSSQPPCFGGSSQPAYAPSFMSVPPPLPLPQGGLAASTAEECPASGAADAAGPEEEWRRGMTSPSTLFEPFPPAPHAGHHQHQLDAFGFDPTAAMQFAAVVPGAPQQQQQQHAVPGFAPLTPPIASHVEQTPPPPPAGRRPGSNSDDDELTPAQSRRKAQNRAAQRAFRERKERHVKELEEKLASLEASSQQTSTENEQLRRRIEKITTENEILRVTGAAAAAAAAMSSASPSAGPGHAPLHTATAAAAAAAPAPTTGPMTYDPDSFYTDMLEGHENKTRSHRVVVSDSGERLLAVAAAWDLIVGHELFRTGRVNLESVSDRLKMHVRCDGQGPVFGERDIRRAIEESVLEEVDDEVL